MRHAIRIKHQSALHRLDTFICSYAAQPECFLPRKLFVEDISQILHRKVIEGLQLHRAQLVRLVGFLILRTHTILQIILPEILRMACAIEIHKFDSLLTSLAEFATLYKPRPQLLQQLWVCATGLDLSRRFRHTLKFLIQIVTFPARVVG